MTVRHHAAIRRIVADHGSALDEEGIHVLNKRLQQWPIRIGIFVLPSLVAASIYLPHGLLMPSRLVIMGLTAAAAWQFLRRPSKDPVLVGVVAVSATFLAFGVLGTLRFPQGVQFSHGAVLGFAVLACLASSILSSDRGVVRAAVWGWLASLAATGVVGTWEILTDQYLPGNTPAVYWKPLDWTYNLIAATYDNPNLYAYHIAVGLLLVPLAWRLAPGWTRWLLIPFAAWQIVLLLRTSGRLAQIAFLIGVVVWLLCNRRTRLVTVILLALLTGSMALGMPPGSQALEYLHLDQATAPGSSIWVRLLLLNSALWILPHTGYLGTGPGGFEHWALLPENPHQFYGLNNAHSGLTEVLCEYGVITFAVFVAALVMMVVCACRWMRRGDAITRALGSAAIALTVTVLPLSTAHSTWLSQPLMGAHLGLAVLLLSACRVSDGQQTATAPTASHHQKALPNSLNR